MKEMASGKFQSRKEGALTRLNAVLDGGQHCAVGVAVRHQVVGELKGPDPLARGAAHHAVGVLEKTQSYQRRMGSSSLASALNPPAPLTRSAKWPMAMA